MMLILSGVSILALSGCGGGSSNYNDGLTTLFLVDENGLSYGGIPYQCESMSNPSETAANGEFSFYPGEECTFDFIGLYGTDTTDTTVPYNEYIYIVDDLENGKNGIDYQCLYFNSGTLSSTYNDGIWDGSFDYDADDACVFYL